MTKKVIRLLGFLLGALLLVYLLYQFYMIAYPAYKTEIALAEKISDSVVVSGIVVRNEMVVENSSSGIVNFLVADGDKVAAGAAVAEVYASAEAASNALRLQLLQDSLDILNKAADLGRTSGSNINSVYAQINKRTSEYVGKLSAADMSSLALYKDELTALLNSFAMASGNTIDFAGATAALEAQIAQYSGAAHAADATIITPESGYFISTVDGYETRINAQNVYDLTADALTELLESAESGLHLDDSHCKVVSDYTWLYAASVPQGMISKFAAGVKYTIDFNYAQVVDVPVTVKQIDYTEGDKTGVVIFECPYLNPTLAKLRCEQGTVSFTEYDGIRVARSALRLVDGVQGVYIKHGSTVEFRKIDKVFETDAYILSRPGASDSDYLALYDEIIIEGKDLAVGKELGN